MPRFLAPALLVIAGLAVIVGLAVIAPRSITPGKPVAVAPRQGFGKLPGLTADGVAAPETAGAPSAPTTARDLAVGVPAPGTTVGSGGGVSGSAGDSIGVGVGVARPGIAYPVQPPEEYLPPRVLYSWEGTSLPSIPAELAVFRTAPPPIGSVAQSFASASGLNLPGGSLTTFSLRGEDGLTYTYDAGGGTLSWYRDRGWMAEQPAAPSTIPDADAIALANAFLAKLGIDLSAYGAPQVMTFEDPCGRGMPCIMEGREGGVSAEDAAVAMPEPAAAPTTVAVPPGDVAPSKLIWPGPWWPSVTVRYDAKLDNLPTLEWDGSDGGVITVQVSAARREVESGSVLLLRGMERSLYPTQSIDAIRAKALLGGINPYGGYENGVYTPAEEAKRPVVRITLTEARLGYLQKWSDDGRGPASYFIPVVAFRGTVVDQFGNSYPHAVIVPALDPAAFATEEPTQVPPPVPLPAVDTPAR